MNIINNMANMEPLDSDQWTDNAQRNLARKNIKDITSQINKLVRVFS